MAGNKIEAVNTAIEKIIPIIKEISDESVDAEVKIAVLEFSTGARWITVDGPVEPDKFHWTALEAYGVADLGEACKALNEKLSRKTFMNDPIGYFAPTIILFSTGKPTDSDIWPDELAKLKQNKWFYASYKLAVAIGDDTNKDVLKEFTGNLEAVLEDHFVLANLKKLIGRCIYFQLVHRWIDIPPQYMFAGEIQELKKYIATNFDAQKQEELNIKLREFKMEIADSDW